jgi:uncharacterized membrane protein
MSNSLESFPVNTRLKLSALWTSVMFCYIYGDYFELYVPHKVEGLLSGNNILDSPLNLLMATVMLTIPALLISISVMAKPGVSRMLNIVFGVFFTLLMLLIAATSLTEWRMFYVFLALVESALTSGVVYQAWNWERKATNPATYERSTRILHGK